MIVRRYQSEDSEHIRRLMGLVGQLGTDAGGDPSGDELERLDEICGQQRGDYLLGFQDGRLVALGAFRPDGGGSAAEIHRLTVHPAYQGNGFGRLMLGELEARAAALGYRKLFLAAPVLQPAALTLFRRCGYQEVGQAVLKGYNRLLFEKMLNQDTASLLAADKPFRIAFVIFEGLTALDFFGAYDPLVRLRTMGFLPELSWEVCALTSVVRDINGLTLAPTSVGNPLSGYDLLLVAGGLATRKLAVDSRFLSWLGTAADARLKASVCTGALLLGAAGFLRDKAATTHPDAYATLAEYCALVTDRRVVEAGDVVTARGVAAAIDLGLHLCGRLAGEEAREQIRRQMDYTSQDDKKRCEKGPKATRPL